METNVKNIMGTSTLSAVIPTLNAATSATQAADIYMNYFERPGIPAAYNREGAAAAVAAACHL